ncbi:MAG TPA: single-stranded-DNA-specific exonuclease RecJ [Anaerolineales bacterium]|nr:single-stranded-DNA-specific exonuclease RecJ [Anaerolineales bacterium]
MKKNWLLRPTMPTPIAQRLGRFHPLVAQLLYNRGIDSLSSAEAYLAARLPDGCDPLLLPDMDKAVGLIQNALVSRQAIAIYGDYDVDGVTASALLSQVLRAYGNTPLVYIPNRFEEGYGLNKDALSELKGKGIELVITVDCGIRSIAEAQHAADIGLKLIITDHHHLGEHLPPALAVINPKREDSSYPEKMLAGVGVAFKLAQAMWQMLGEPNGGLQKKDLLDLVALGTVADIAPLSGENRALVYWGLKSLRQSQRPGIQALCAVSQTNQAEITATSIGFVLGPRLNAAGRLDSALAAYELLTTTDPTRAKELAESLDSQNKERQELTRSITERAKELALQNWVDTLPPILFAADESFNEGVVGLAASRLMNEFYRPSFVAAHHAGVVKGSARSIPEFHVTEALDACAELLERHGGHAAAAGFSLQAQNLPALIEKLTAYAAQQFAQQDLRQTLLIDAFCQPEDLSLELFQQISQLEPYGYGNPQPVFAMQAVTPFAVRTMGRDNDHLKLVFRDGQGRFLDAVGWRMGKDALQMQGKLDVAFGLEINEWQGKKSLQLNLKDVRVS